jgi:hypothetical protein
VMQKFSYDFRKKGENCKLHALFEWDTYR